MTGIPFAILRHGPTDWNATGRLQGLTDTDLSPDGEMLVRRWRLPPGVRMGGGTNLPPSGRTMRTGVGKVRTGRSAKAMPFRTYGRWTAASIEPAYP